MNFAALNVLFLVIILLPLSGPIINYEVSYSGIGSRKTSGAVITNLLVKCGERPVVTER